MMEKESLSQKWKQAIPRMIDNYKKSLPKRRPPDKEEEPKKTED